MDVSLTPSRISPPSTSPSLALLQSHPLCFPHAPAYPAPPSPLSSLFSPCPPSPRWPRALAPAASTSRMCARQHRSPWETMSRPTHPRRSCWPETIRCRASPPPPYPSFLQHTALAIPHLASSATNASTATSGDRRPGGRPFHRRPPPDVNPVPRLLSILPSRESIQAGYPLQIRFFVGLWAYPSSLST